MSYIDGFVLPVSEGNIDAYREMSSKAGAIWKEHGALMYKELVLEDNSAEMGMAKFPELVDAKQGETTIMAFILYRSRQHRDEVNAKVMADPRLKDSCDPENMPFDFKRMAYGGFKAIVDL